ncbi:radical SAM additional 4Fe4S-binding domain protein [Desulfosporosinus orientis DSM 765]|uniref:Radical SAM additional 4Fe4S-binding domain protein n=1 Tax=Desulfosporosinus orientis (strain ATCC 19365 / DSM 765 / NCIMB 8382 / VKM B-1628 / Singapore I) TaxID=768706 RepID=G7W6T3_DESOD|nr:radical SAM protein [Desulfosporosinus orientis]AET69215.1 radical SAM additional 4Fe4S-binding domain protein [Desulfosporosinus orientis DSM 765]
MRECYAKLNSPWLLRGWQDMPWAITNWKTGLLRQLGQDIFYVAQSCDGQTNFNSPAFLPGHIKLLERLISEGIATECRQGEKLAKVQEYRQAANPLVRGIHWALTGRCNMNCRHCFMESPSGRYGHPGRETIRHFIRQFERANVLQVSLTGGEPLLREDLLEIMEELTARRIRLTEIATNGTLITPRLLEAIKSLGQAPDFKISFDGAGVHDRMRGTWGTEERVSEAIRQVVASGLTVAVSTTLDRDNIEALPRTYELIKELQVPVWLIGRPQTTGNWCGGPAALSTEEMAHACEDLLRRWLDDGQPFYILLERFFGGGPGILERKKLNQSDRSAQAGQPSGPSEPSRLGANHPHGRPGSFTPESYECDSVREKPYLLPDGRLLPCVGFTATDLHEQMPNLLEQELAEVWHASALRDLADMKKREVLAANPECVVCGMFAACGAGCRAYALTESGSLLDRDPMACALWRGGYRERFAAIARADAAAANNHQDGVISPCSK